MNGTTFSLSTVLLGAAVLAPLGAQAAPCPMTASNTVTTSVSCEIAGAVLGQPVSGVNPVSVMGSATVVLQAAAVDAWRSGGGGGIGLLTTAATATLQATGDVTVHDGNSANARGVFNMGTMTFDKSLTVYKPNLPGIDPTSSNNGSAIQQGPNTGVPSTGTLTVNGNTTVFSNVASPGNSNTLSRDGIRHNSGTSNYNGDVTINSQGGTRTGFLQSSPGSGTVSIGGAFTVNHTATMYALTQAGHAALNQQAPTGIFKVTGLSTLTANADGAAAVISDATLNLNGGATLTANGNVFGSGQSAAGLRLATTAKVTLGSPSLISATGVAGIGAYLAGAASLAAASGLVVNATGSNGTAFKYLGATAPITLDNATVTAPVLWNADATTNTAFTATGGTYTGASLQAAGGQLSLNMANAALWNVKADSSFKTLAIAGNAVVDASQVNPLALTGAVTHGPGVISLTRSDASPSNQVHVIGAYASGGTLELNTVMNEGDAASQSDVLTVDAATLGAGPTQLSITPEGAGALTVNKGILVVKVSGGIAASAAGAFAMAPLTQGGFVYKLVQDTADGNWYLQSKTVPVDPPTNPSGVVSAPVPSSTAWSLLAMSLLVLMGAWRLRRRSIWPR